MNVTEQLPEVAQYTQLQNVERNTQAYRKAEELLVKIAEALTPGMTETQAREHAMAIFAAHGVTTHWHRPYIYFGSNTLMTFLDKPVEEKTLQASDIVYIDIGPVIDGVEGDTGKTFVYGEDPLFLNLQYQSEQIFSLARQFWREHQPTGIALYQHVAKLAEEAGLLFHLDPAGHLIGEHPHLGWKKGLNHYAYYPEPGMWILEVHVRHPEKPYGAFYESILV